MKPTPIAETVTEAFLQWMAPMIFAGFFLLFIAGVLAFFSAVMAFVFGITFVVKEGALLIGLSSQITAVLLTASVFLSIWGAFNLFCLWRYKFGQRS